MFAGDTTTPLTHTRSSSLSRYLLRRRCRRCWQLPAVFVPTTPDETPHTLHLPITHLSRAHDYLRENPDHLHCRRGGDDDLTAETSCLAAGHGSSLLLFQTCTVVVADTVATTVIPPFLANFCNDDDADVWFNYNSNFYVFGQIWLRCQFRFCLDVRVRYESTQLRFVSNPVDSVNTRVNSGQHRSNRLTAVNSRPGMS
ncbi:hypothetical protein Hdeb2414_s0006g00220471 [Helianthus debilis subsp. tardiflorus]